MPDVTPNRQYPFPEGTDPVDTAGDIQRLAEAIDADLDETLIQSGTVTPTYDAFGNFNVGFPKPFRAGTIPTVLATVTFGGYGEMIVSTSGGSGANPHLVVQMHFHNSNTNSVPVPGLSIPVAWFAYGLRP